MQYYIDTNIFLLLFKYRDELVPDVSMILGDVHNTLVISVESVREILMLIKNGKINFKELRSYDDIIGVLQNNRVKIRFVDENHLKKLSDLIPAPNHSDPADLMIIAQAITENTPIISTDAKFKFYKKQRLQLIQNNNSKR